MYECEVTLSSQNRISFKRMSSGQVVVELWQAKGDGYLVTDSVFLTLSEIEALHYALGYEPVLERARQEGDVILPATFDSETG